MTKQAKNLQPNFEKIKTAFYQCFIDSTDVNCAVIKETIAAGQLLPSWSERKNSFIKDFNKWLNSIDIRQAGQLIIIIKQQNKLLPKWAAEGKYYIDYNENGVLDLIIKR